MLLGIRDEHDALYYISWPSLGNSRQRSTLSSSRDRLKPAVAFSRILILLVIDVWYFRRYKSRSGFRENSRRFKVSRDAPCEDELFKEFPISWSSSSCCISHVSTDQESGGIARKLFKIRSQERRSERMSEPPVGLFAQTFEFERSTKTDWFSRRILFTTSWKVRHPFVVEGFPMHSSVFT